MAVNQEVVITFNADTSGVEKNISQVEKGVQDTSKATAGLTNQLDKMTGGAVTGLKNFGKGLKSGISGLKSFKVALAATGIGLLIVAVGTLISYFTSTKKGAEQLKVATAALGAAFDVLKDRVSQIGGALVKFFTGDFSGALEDVKGAFTGITDEIIREASAARNLQRDMNALKDAERDFIKVRAETNKAIAETRLRVEDETLSYDQRVEALEKAIALEQETAAEELRMAEERARIVRERIALGESLEDDLDSLAEAEARVIDMETASLRMQKRLEGERQSLMLQAQAQRQKEKDAREKEAEEKSKAAEKEAEEREKAYQAELSARQKLEDELYALTLSAREREELALMQKYDDRVAIAGDDEGLLKAATEQLNADLAAIEQKYIDQKAKAEEDARKKEKEEKDKAAAEDLARAERLAEQEKRIEQAKKDVRDQTLNALAALNQAFTGESEEQQKKGLERSKKIQTAQALISTYESAVQAFKSLAGIPVVGPGLGAAAAAAATAAGLANVKQIQSQQYQSASAGGGGAGYSSAGSSPASGAQQAPTAPTLDLSFLGQGAGQSQPIQAYVLAENVSNAQQANQKIQDQATL